MNSRDTILANLKAQARNVPHPPAWRSRRKFDDLAERFTMALTAVKGEVIRAGSLEEATAKLAEQLEAFNARQVVANNVAPLNELNLPGRWPAIDWHVVDQTAGDLRTFCAGADVGLSSADVALAETGTIILSSGPGRSRLATLLPPVHLALVPTTCLTADIFTWLGARDDRPLPTNLILVSGPSKTADIERILAVGVHGPKRFIVILYEDAG